MKEMEKIDASIYLYDCLKEVLPEKATNFMIELKNRLEKSYEILYFDEKEISEIYADNNSTPGIYLKFAKEEIEKKNYYFTLKIELDEDKLLLCFGFDSKVRKEDKEELSSIKLNDMKNISKDFYENLTKLKDNLNQKNIESMNGKKAIVISLENTNFRKICSSNEFLLNLLEDDTREKEVNRIYKEIDDILDKVGLKNRE